MRKKILSNYTEHNPDCESVKLHEELMRYTDIMLLGCIDPDEWDANLNQIKETLTKNEENKAYATYDINFMRLYIQSLKDNYYWEYCPFEVYKKTLPTAIKHYLRYSPDSTEKDFYINELIDICDLDSGFDKKMKEPKFSFSEFYSHPKKVMVHGKSGAYGIQFRDTSFYDVIDTTQRKKINYLIELAEEKKQNIPNQAEGELLTDYSNSKDIEKIIFLHELGILDFLKEKMNKDLHYFNANKLGQIVSTFTGIEKLTAQSYLNPIFSNLNTKNPLKSKNLERVVDKLNSIGFTHTKSTK